MPRCGVSADRRPRDGRGFAPHPGYVARARSLELLLAAAADEVERNRELPGPIVSTLIDNGLFRLLQPRSLSSAELDPMTYVRVVEQIASHDASTGWCVEQANGCSMAAAFLDPEVAQEIFGPPDGIVAWGPGRPGRATRCPRRVPSGSDRRALRRHGRRTCL
jgi:indole-3-acetate monooxygenase